MAAKTGSDSTQFFTIVGGKFAKRVDAETPNAVARTLTKGKNEGNEVHELLYSELVGKIDQVKIEDKEWGQNINIVLDDGDTLSLSLDSNIGNVFAKIIPNIETDLPVTLKTWMDDEGKTAFTIMQKDQYLKWAFTRDYPNGMPQAVEKTVAGKTKWDFDEQKEFLYNVLVENAKRFQSQYDQDVPAKIAGIIPMAKDQPEETPLEQPEDGKVKIEDVPF